MAGKGLLIRLHLVAGHHSEICMNPLPVRIPGITCLDKDALETHYFVFSRLLLFVCLHGLFASFEKTVKCIEIF